MESSSTQKNENVSIDLDFDMEDVENEKFKSKVHKALSKLMDHSTVLDFAICGELENAPTVIISIKVIHFRTINISSLLQHNEK